MIQCSKCGERAEPYRKGSRICLPCNVAYHRAYNVANNERLRKQKLEYLRAKSERNPEWLRAERKRQREYWQRLRHEVITAYGGYVCACCGETEPQFLSIDHVFNDGAKHRRELGYKNANGKGASSRTLKWLKDHGFPKGFQVLCMNCNTGKQRNGGTCPHKANTSGWIAGQLSEAA